MILSVEMIEMSLDKQKIARRQLGTALALFLGDQDPVSVHCLACGGGEVAESLTKKAGAQPFAEHVFLTSPDVTPKELARLKNRYWNAFKHASDRSGAERADGETINRFTDEVNDHVLFIAWHDYMMATQRTPIEAQAFQAWYFAMYPEKLAPPLSAQVYLDIFPGIMGMVRSAKKALLRQVIEEHRGNPAVMKHPKTDPQPLVLGTF